MATLDFWGILALINDEFPQYVPILQQPGVFDVFVRYAQAKSSGINPWTPDQLLAELHKTPYYQSTPAPVRQFDLLLATDPATAAQKIEQTKRIIDDLQRQTGITLDATGGLSSPAFAFLQQAVAYGWDANEIKYRMLASVNSTHAGGELGSTAAQVRNMADQYGVPLSDDAVLDYARKLSEGAIDQAGLQGYLIEQAKSLFPGLATALDKGITVKQYADPYLQIAAQELNINPADVNLTDQKWMAALNQIDPKTGARVSMSLDDWLRKIRTDPTYGYDKTLKAGNDATQLSVALQQRLGAIG